MEQDLKERIQEIEDKYGYHIADGKTANAILEISECMKQLLQRVKELEKK